MELDPGRRQYHGVSAALALQQAKLSYAVTSHDMLSRHSKPMHISSDPHVQQLTASHERHESRQPSGQLTGPNPEGFLSVNLASADDLSRIHQRRQITAGPSSGWIGKGSGLARIRLL